MDDMDGGAWNWATRPLRHYAEFSGRSPRAEYWWFTLLLFGGLMLCAAMFGILTAGQGDTASAVLIIFAVIAMLAIFIPSLAVQVRRLHDQDRSGWWLLISVIPYLGTLTVLIFMLIPGTRGPNRFGEDPYADLRVGERR